MQYIREILFYTAGFAVIAIAANQISRLFAKIRLPLITGLLATGMIAGPFLLNLIPSEAPKNLNFINDLSLAFIAFAAGSELFLKDIRSRIKNIAWMTFGQLVVTFIMGAVAVYLLAGYIPFMKTMAPGAKFAVAILAGTIFVARSPASAIAIMNEMRAKGPFTATALGVTVVKDVLVIILFAVCFSVSEQLVMGTPFNAMVIVYLVLELLVSFGLGWLLGKFIGMFLGLPVPKLVKTALLLLSGFGIYMLSHWVKEVTGHYIHHEFHIEPLLICIIGAFIVTNYSNYRKIFHEIIEETGPAVYVLFFTLTGASMSLDVLAKVWGIALILFAVRLVSMIIGAIVGGTLGGDPWKMNRIAWMPYVTQAGVGLGLATLVAGKYPEWGLEFATIMIAVIVLNQFVGPPLFKWAIIKAGEDHSRAPTPDFDGIKDCLIFGLEPQSIALAQQLKAHGWGVKIATLSEITEDYSGLDVEIKKIPGIYPGAFHLVDAGKAECIVCMFDDEKNYQVCEVAYEQFGTRDIVVRLNDRANFQKFHQLGALIVDPSTAIVSLLDHFVRSPNAATLLLGMQEDQDTMDLELFSRELHGVALRDLRLPNDVIILSVKRGNQQIISHGYTRLRVGDIITVVGSNESLKKVSLQFEAI